MKGYIYDDDRRSRVLKNLFEQQNYLALNENDAGFLYVGKDLLRCKDNKINFSLLSGNNVICINTDKKFKKENDNLTKIGFITYLISHNALPINKRILIIGYGQLAKIIAKELKQLDNVITIANRNYKEINDILKEYRHEDINSFTYNYDVIINTVNHRYLQKYYFKNQKIYDLADYIECDYDDYISLRSLPNDFFPEYSALEIYQCIQRMIKDVKG